MNKIEDMIDKLPYIEFEYNGGRGYGKSYIAEIIEEKDKEIQHLKSIIKEVREYIENENNERFGNPTIEFSLDVRKKILLEILDKENK